MFCKDRGIDFPVSGCAGYTRDMRGQHFWAFPLYSSALRVFPLYHQLVGKRSFPTLQPSSKTKISAQA